MPSAQCLTQTSDEDVGRRLALLDEAFVGTIYRRHQRLEEVMLLCALGCICLPCKLVPLDCICRNSSPTTQRLGEHGQGGVRHLGALKHSHLDGELHAEVERLWSRTRKAVDGLVVVASDGERGGPPGAAVRVRLEDEHEYKDDL